MEQAKILMDEAEENNLSDKTWNERFKRWYACSLCEQEYHGVVRCALGWTCWKTYLGRPETDQIYGIAMNVLGAGLFQGKNHEDALPVEEARISMLRRTGASEERMLISLGNLASTYQSIGRREEALRIRREVYSGNLRLYGEQDEKTIRDANNYAVVLLSLQLFGEAKRLVRKAIPNARRTLGAEHDLTLNFRDIYGRSLFLDPSASRDDVAEAIEIFVDVQRRAWRVFGPKHPNWTHFPKLLEGAREKLASFDDT